MVRIQTSRQEEQDFTVTGNSSYRFFNNEPFLPRFVGLVRQVRTVRKSRQHYPDGPDWMRLPDCGLFQDEFQVFARIFLPGDPADKDPKSGLDRFREFPEESVLIPVVGQQRHSFGPFIPCIDQNGLRPVRFCFGKMAFLLQHVGRCG